MVDLEETRKKTSSDDINKKEAADRNLWHLHSPIVQDAAPEKQA